MNTRLDAIELQFKRIGRTSANDNATEQDSPEYKAYTAYLRTGETKALTTGDDTLAKRNMSSTVRARRGDS